MKPYLKNKENRASTLFRVLSYDAESNLFLTDERKITYGFVCYPMTGVGDTLGSRLDSLLNYEWPVGTTLQFNLLSSDNINRQVNGYRSLRMNQKDELLNSFVESRSKFLIRGSEVPPDLQSGVLFRNISLIVSVKIPVKSLMPNELEIEECSEFQVYTKKTLKDIGMYPESMDADMYIRVMDDVIHHGKKSSWRDNFPRFAEKDKPLNEQILDKDKSINVSDKRLTVGDQIVRVLSVKRFPEVAFVGYGLNYIGELLTGARGIRGHFLFSMSVHYPNKLKLKSRIDMKRTATVGQLTGRLAKFAPVIALKAHGFEVLNQAFDDGDSPVQVFFSVATFADTEEKSIELTAGVKSYLGEYGFQLMNDKYYCLPIFLNNLPFGADNNAISDLFRYKTMATRHAGALLPIFGDWQGTGTPVLNFVSRNGQVMNYDFYDSNTNYGVCIAAESGAGKSFATSYMISNYLSIGAKCWVIDAGRSYENICESFDGVFLHFAKDNDICLNPFELVKDFDDESDMLTGLLSAMAAPSEGLDDYRSANIKKVLSEIWHLKGRDMTVDDIESKLLDSKDQRIRDIGEQLFPFTSKGQYGKYFNGKNNISFENRFTVLELGDLQGREHLQSVVLLQLIYQIQQDMVSTDRSQRKLILIDEAWQFLAANAAIAGFISDAYRRWRKLRGSPCVITQSVLDLYMNDVGRVIVENSSNMILLSQKNQAISTLKQKKLLPISEGGYELLKTVHSDTGNYSELFFITEYGQGVGRLMVDPYQVLLLSTRGEDVSDIKNYRKMGYKMHDAIVQVMKDRGISESDYFKEAS